jgi:hypothetical protein
MTKTALANIALGEIGAARIADFDADTTQEAKAVREQYDLVRDELLRRHQWSFGTRRVGLSKLPTPPATEYAAAWQLPADLVRHIRIVGTDVHNPIRDYAIEGRQLLTRDFASLSIVYVSNLTPPDEWDALFIRAFSLALAAAIAPRVAKSPEMANAMTQKLHSLGLPLAQSADTRESASGENFGPRALISQSGLVNARFTDSGRPPYFPTLP